MKRLLVSLVLGVAITFGLFVFMSELIAKGGRPPEGPSSNTVIEIVMDKPKSSVQKIKRVPPPPPPPPKTPPKTPPVEPDPVDNSTGGISLEVPDVQVESSSISLGQPSAGVSRDGDATPIVRIEPKYPIKASRDGKEGWVRLSFTINEIGGVEDVKVIEAEPKRLFDKEAKRALRKWKYKPKIVDGKAVKQPGLQVRLEFNLNKDN